MAEILRFFVRFAPLVFLLLAFGVLFGFRRLSRAHTLQREAVYGLEKEIAQRLASQAIAALSVTGVIIFAEFILVVFLAPNVPALSLIATPTMDPLYVPTSTLSPSTLATLGATTPDASLQDASSGCIPGQIMMTSPKPGAEIRGQVILEGTVDVPNLGFYKYEYSPLGMDAWSTIGGNHTVVQDGELGRWNTTEITPGDYELRLVVTDNATNAFPTCVISLRVLAP